MTSQKVVLVGDLNARIGDLSVFDDEKQTVKYSKNPDQGINRNGRDIAALCKATI